jgi:hypothetical protein
VALDPDDIERIAQRVAELLANDHWMSRAHARAGAPEAVRLVDAATVARTLGVTRDWVYLHANELGAIRLGGKRGRLRFDLQKIGDQDPDQAAVCGPDRRGPRPGRGPWLSRESHLASKAGALRSGRAAWQRPRPDTERMERPMHPHGSARTR